MGTNAGVWIDHEQAIVVLITDAGQELKRIASDIGQPALTSKNASGRHKYTPNDFIAEDKLERKAKAGRKSYFDDVIACIRGAGSLLGERQIEIYRKLTFVKTRLFIRLL
jgi:hypothetical protein